MYYLLERTYFRLYIVKKTHKPEYTAGALHRHEPIPPTHCRQMHETNIPLLRIVVVTSLFLSITETYLLHMLTKWNSLWKESDYRERLYCQMLKMKNWEKHLCFDYSL